MTHTIHKIISFKIAGDYTLELTFEDSKKKKINFLPVLFGEIYSPLRNIEIFNKVRIDPEVHTLVWENGADFDPSILYDWDKYSDELSLRAKKWEWVNH